MTVDYVSTSNKQFTGGTNSDGKVFGNSATDPIAFYGGTPTAQVTLTTIATGATIATAVARLQAIIALLQGNGLAG